MGKDKDGLQAQGALHVGLYAGGDRFIHAPSSRKCVREDRLSNPYWASRLLSVRRILPPKTQKVIQTSF